MIHFGQILPLFRGKGPALNQLIQDVFLDNIFIYLDVEDIIRFRMVNKFLLTLTEEASIWKRFLRRTTFPLPPMPPVSRYSLEHISSLEAERLLTRAISLDKNWRKPHPDTLDGYHFDARCYIYSMVLVPGSRYLVASVRGSAYRDFRIIVYMLDDRDRTRAVAQLLIKSNAYQLQAKYLNIQDKNGLVISYVCTRPKYRSDASIGFEHTPGYDKEVNFPLRHECKCVFISLSEMEGSADLQPGSEEFLRRAKAKGPPFRSLLKMESNEAFGVTHLGEMFGIPYLAVVKPPNKIVFNSLVGRIGPVIQTCPPLPNLGQYTYSIVALRMLPEQHQILVLRKIMTRPPEPSRSGTTFELYHIPANTVKHSIEEAILPTEWRIYDKEELVDIQIPDHDIPIWDDESLRRELDPDVYRGRPLTMHARTLKPPGLLQITLNAQRVEVQGDDLATTFATRYSVHDVKDFWGWNAPPDQVFGILAGSSRSVVYTKDINDISLYPRVLDLFRYSDDQSMLIPDQMQHSSVAQKPQPRLRNFAFIMNDLRSAAMAWDETTGRLCMVNEGSMRIHVLDFAKAPKEDIEGRRLPLCLKSSAQPCTSNSNTGSWAP